MKKIIVVIIGILLICFLIINHYVNKNDKYYTNIEKNILKKTDIKNINYINVYGDYYIVKSDKYLYVFDKKYTEIMKIDNIIIYENTFDYDIIYEDDAVMYYNDIYKGGKLEVEYYDLYTYKLIKKVLVNG